jgi:uncharacterized protein YecE (DUF72 family)
VIRIGPAGWSYPDWEGVVYPPGFPKSSQLALLAGRTDAVEVNTSFYRIPSPALAEGWARKVEGNPGFRFTVKAWRGWTHDGEPADRGAEAFGDALRPLQDAGRLGLVLFQFPWSFKDGPEARARLDALAARFAGLPCGAEVRHGSFHDPGFLAFLRERAWAFANIDQPVIGDSLPPTGERTASAAYVRFHGRNYAKWFAHGEAWERYDYLYSPQELEPWAARIRALAKEGDVYVILNNHYRGQALRNAADLGRLLGTGRPDGTLPLLLQAGPLRLA